MSDGTETARRSKVKDGSESERGPPRVLVRSIAWSDLNASIRRLRLRNPAFGALGRHAIQSEGHR
jgi:hypothetical protein